ncbi:MAG TPA: restriction endonuclease, partial [Pyrinomonadaceae bacterium]|nr:restriction endonuclease [Pyrinomonadaceae bacterium]
DNPQVVMAAGFQEYVGAHKLPIYRSILKRGHLIKGQRPAFRLFDGRWLIISFVGNDECDKWDGFSLEAYKDLLQSVDADSSEFDDLFEKNVVIELPSANQIIDVASRFVGTPFADVTNFVSPKLWTPSNQDRQKEYLSATTQELIRAIQKEKITLDGVHWRQLEDIVAEILRSRGMEIHVVRENPQGGRDVIARGELIPGMDVVSIAIEVKHKKVVNRPDLQLAIQQNHHFPALMFITSGEFSSGVIQEANRTDNRLRLFLKNGVALRELIRTYRLV